MTTSPSPAGPAPAPPRPRRPVRLVCFDLGGVLVRICRSWEEGCRAAGLDARPRVDDPALAARRRAVSHAYSLGRIDCRTCFRALADATGGSYTPAEIARIHDAWLLGEYPGVAGVVERLAASPRVRTGVLSNTNHRHWVRLDARGGRRAEFRAVSLLANRHASHLLGLAKPDAAIFRAFERAAGARAEQVLFFDDLEENAAAAAAAGWRVVRIDHAGDPAAQVAEGLAAHGVW